MVTSERLYVVLTFLFVYALIQSLDGTIMKFLSTEILMKVIDIFCSTNELLVQEKATDVLYRIINHGKKFVRVDLHWLANSSNP